MADLKTGMQAHLHAYVVLALVRRIERHDHPSVIADDMVQSHVDFAAFSHWCEDNDGGGLPHEVQAAAKEWQRLSDERREWYRNIVRPRILAIAVSGGLDG